jgi:hypothetical protein
VSARLALIAGLAVIVGLVYWAGDSNGYARCNAASWQQSQVDTAQAMKEQADIQAATSIAAADFRESMTRAQLALGDKDAQIKQLAADLEQRNAQSGAGVAVGGADYLHSVFAARVWNIAAATDTLPPDPDRRTVDATRAGAQVIQDSAADNIRLRLKVNALQTTMRTIQPDQ